MRSLFANLRTLVLPAGQTQGRRIVLDGVNGRIDIYDETDTLVARLDDDGLHIILPDGEIYINDSLGIYLRNTNGAGLEMTTDPVFGAVLLGQPPDLVGVTFRASAYASNTFPFLNNAPYLALASPSYATPTARAAARINLIGEDDTGNPPYLQTDQSIRDPDGITYLKGQQGTETCSIAAVVEDTFPVVFPVPFQPGSAPQVQVNFRTSPAGSARWVVRANGISETGFTIRITNIENPPAVGTFSINVGWTATVTG